MKADMNGELFECLATNTADQLIIDVNAQQQQRKRIRQYADRSIGLFHDDRTEIELVA